MFILKSERKTYSYASHRDALSVLLTAQINGANIWLESDTHYFDKDCKDILLIANNENLNENDNGNTREIIKPKPKHKGKVR
jgi:hypothetical protein